MPTQFYQKFIVVTLTQNMNSFNSSVVYLLIVATFASGTMLNDLERKARARALVLNCREETGAAPNDLQELIRFKLPESHQGLCLLECIFDKVEIMQNGKFNQAGLVKTLRRITKSDDNNITDELSKFCQKQVTGNDKCEVAGKIAECVIQNGNNYGLKMPKAM